MPDQSHSGTGVNVGGNQTNIDRQINQGPGSTYNEKVLMAPAPSLPKALSAKLPKTAPDKIVGREQELSALHQRLGAHRQVVLVNGLGGIGKTTLAQVYVAQYWDEYHHVAWVSQVSDNLINDFVNTEGLLERLQIPVGGADANALFGALMAALQTIGRQPNLLVIDNADSRLGDLYDYLPAQPLWHILVTSRHQIPKFDRLELGFLAEEEAIELFLREYTLGKITRDAIRALVNAVDLHTLTIEILAKTAQTQRTPIDQLQQALAADLKANVYVAHKGQKIEKITSYLCSIFRLSGLRAHELWLLTQFTCLPPEFHRYELLQELIQPEASENAAIFAETLDALTATGWLLCNAATDSYKMHRIIADVVKQQHAITVSDVEPLIKSVTAKLSVDQSKDNPVDKFPWIPFGQAVVALFPESELPTIATLQNNLALRLKELGDYAGAQSLSAKAVRSAEQTFGPDHPTTAVSYSNLAVVLKDLGNYAGAQTLLEKAVRSDEHNFGPDHPNTAVRYSNLALVLKDLGDYAGAQTLLEKAVRSDEHNFGPDHPNTAVRYSNLALVLQDLGDYAGAQSLLEKAVRSDEYNFGPDHPNTAVSYSNLAVVLKDLGDYAGAQSLLAKAVRSDEHNFGPDHPTTAVRYSNLALVRQALGDYVGAQTLLEKAVRSDEHNFGPDHPTTAVRYSNLALVLKDLGDYVGAQTLLEKAVRSDEHNFGPDHPTTAVSYSNLALVLKALGDYVGALALSGKALRIFQKTLPPGHPYIKTVADIYQAIQQQMQSPPGAA